MDGIHHRTVAVNGIKMHVAEKGEGPIILFLHGFPQLWYCWRHQITALSALGYRTIAPDLRGFGDTDAPPSAAAYTTLHIVGDLVALIDSLGAEKVYVVGHDWGAVIAWALCLYRPDRVKALVNLSVPFPPRNPKAKPVESLRALHGNDYYVCRFQEPGEIEAEFAKIGAWGVIKFFLTYHTPTPLRLPKGEKGFIDLPSTTATLPSWLSEDDLSLYASKYEQRGFTGGLNYYRALNLNWELTAPWTGVEVKVPVKYIVGDQDLTLSAPTIKHYVKNGGMKKDVPLLEVIVMEGVGHFIQEEKVDEINMHIYNFFQKF